MQTELNEGPDLCQSFSNLFDDAQSDNEECSEQNSSAKVREQKRIRKLQRYESSVARRRLNRINEHAKRRARYKKTARIIEKLPFLLDVYIDFRFTSVMSEKEMSRLVRQMGRVWGLQKRYSGLQVTLFSPSDKFLAEARKVLSGFDAFGWKVSNDEWFEKNCGKSLVYLSPDAESPPLLELSTSEAYVIGGLVDETGVGPSSKQIANDSNAKLRRLPICEFMKKKEHGTFNVMLAINQVVEILARYSLTQQWSQSLASVLPSRIGYEPK